MQAYMTIETVRLAVKTLGLTFRYQREYDEFRIDYKRSDSRWSEDSAYFTTYRDDAIETAKAMASFVQGQ